MVTGPAKILVREIYLSLRGSEINRFPKKNIFLRVQLNIYKIMMNCVLIAVDLIVAIVIVRHNCVIRTGATTCTDSRL